MPGGSQLKKRIVVIEDDVEIRDLLAYALKARGYEVSEAPNGDVGLRILREVKDEVAAILLDLMMPVMNGWEVIESLHADESLRAIPVVVMSGLKESALTDHRSEVRAYLRKPIELGQLYLTLAGCQDAVCTSEFATNVES